MACATTLITDGASHYCEKARWALERAGVAHVETKHVVLLHMFFTRGLGVGTSCPKLVIGRSSNKVVLQESPEILRFADKSIERQEDRLYPDDPELRKLVRAWEWKFDKQLGPHVRRWSYCYLLFDQCSYKLLSQGVSLVERIFAWLLMPFVRRVVYRALYCDRKGAKERSLQVIEAIFKEVDELLADGRPYICGDRFTAADITFAALGGPMVAPPEYGAWLPLIEECPHDMASTMNGFRKSPAGRHILKIYNTKRHKSHNGEKVSGINESGMCTNRDDTKGHEHASQEIVSKRGPNDVNMINEKICDTKPHKPQEEIAPGACKANMINECKWCIQKGAYQVNKGSMECRWCSIGEAGEIM